MAKSRSPWFRLLRLMFEPKSTPAREFARKATVGTLGYSVPIAGALGTAQLMGAKPGEAIPNLISLIRGLSDPQLAENIAASTRGLQTAKESIGSATQLARQVNEAMQTGRELARPLSPYLPYTAGGSLIGAAALGIPALLRGTLAKDEDRLGWMARNPGIAALLGSALGAAGGGLYKYMQRGSGAAPKVAAYALGQAIGEGALS